MLGSVNRTQDVEAVFLVSRSFKWETNLRKVSFSVKVRLAFVLNPELLLLYNNSLIFPRHLRICNKNSKWPAKIKAMRHSHLQGLNPSSTPSRSLPTLQRGYSYFSRAGYTCAQEQQCLHGPFPSHPPFFQGNIQGWFEVQRTTLQQHYPAVLTVVFLNAPRQSKEKSIPTPSSQGSSWIAQI